MSVKKLLLKNDKYGPTSQKLKNGQKRQKLLIHNENSLVRVFITKQQNKILWQKELFFDQNCPKTLEIIENLLTNDKTDKQHKNWKLVKTVKNRKKKKLKTARKWFSLPTTNKEVLN